MRGVDSTPSLRQAELLERAYDYVTANGLSTLSLRPLAAAIDSSPRVLLFLFGSKDGLVRALLERARNDELALLDTIRVGIDPGSEAGSLPLVIRELWGWLSDPRHRGVLTLWVEAYARSLSDPSGPWGDFAAATVQDWLGVLATAQPVAWRDTHEGLAERTHALALLRGALLDLLATRDVERLSEAIAADQPKR